MTCKNCGFENDINNNFCIHCGNNLKINQSNSSSQDNTLHTTEKLLLCFIIAPLVILIYEIIFSAIISKLFDESTSFKLIVLVGPPLSIILTVITFKKLLFRTKIVNQN
ncbi:MAG TPA: hypothetical protein DCE23_08650 [Firmicutes bacterium]|nr:hypothetical protein [Bacillota bacterium]